MILSGLDQSWEISSSLHVIFPHFCLEKDLSRHTDSHLQSRIRFIWILFQILPSIYQLQDQLINEKQDRGRAILHLAFIWTVNPNLTPLVLIHIFQIWIFEKMSQASSSTQKKCILIWTNQELLLARIIRNRQHQEWKTHLCKFY